MSNPRGINAEKAGADDELGLVLGDGDAGVSAADRLYCGYQDS